MHDSSYHFETPCEVSGIDKLERSNNDRRDRVLSSIARLQIRAQVRNAVESSKGNSAENQTRKQELFYNFRALFERDISNGKGARRMQKGRVFEPVEKR